MLEVAYSLMRHLNISFAEIRRMPVRYRRWMIERLRKDLTPQTTTNTGGIELDDDTPISQVLGPRINS